jgi:hypothetical protein
MSTATAAGRSSRRIAPPAAQPPPRRSGTSVFPDAGLRMVCHALLAHASAALGDAQLRDELEGSLDPQGPPQHRPPRPTALAHLGKAAACANEWLRVQQIVRAFHDLPARWQSSPASSTATAKRVVEIQTSGSSPP